MRILAFLLLLAAATPWEASSQFPEDVRQRLMRQVTRLSPAVFRDLPEPVVQELNHRGCRIPQLWNDPKPHNVIRGEFTQAGQVDWAALCSVKGFSSILVFRNGTGLDPVQLARQEDSLEFIEGLNSDKVGNNRIIYPAGQRDIMGHWTKHGGPKPPPIGHQGIEDGHAEKGSSVHYYYQGKWRVLTGSD